MPTSNSNISWIYGISIILTTMAGIGSIFLANKIYPMTGGDESITENKIEEEQPDTDENETDSEAEEEVAQAPLQQTMVGGELNTTWINPHTNGLSYQF